MVTFIALCAIAGILLGSLFRIGIMIPAVAVVVAASLLVANPEQGAPWYLLALFGAIAAQVGFGLAALLKPARKGERPAGKVAPPAISRRSNG